MERERIRAFQLGPFGRYGYLPLPPSDRPAIGSMIDFSPSLTGGRDRRRRRYRFARPTKCSSRRVLFRVDIRIVVTCPCAPIPASLGRWSPQPISIVWRVRGTLFFVEPSRPTNRPGCETCDFAGRSAAWPTFVAKEPLRRYGPHRPSELR